MTAQSPSEPATAPVSGRKITDLLPEVQWAGELLYHCIRSHEERVQELQASKPGYSATTSSKRINSCSMLA